MNVIIARIAGVIAAALVTWIIGLLGVPVSEDQKAGAVAWLTHGLTGLGFVIGLFLYGLVHKFTSRFTNPADSAKNPELAAQRIGADLKAAP